MNEKGDLIDTKYDNCISLGWFCGTASSMAQYGLRSFSGPFDWCTSNLNSVLKMLENDFEDFMKKENLAVVGGDTKTLYDKKYGFGYNHEVIYSDFEQEYFKIFEKYHRRAKRVIKATKKPTCFLRTVENEEEIEYIKENKKYIYSVVKRNNVNNEIIFLVAKNMVNLPDDFSWFRLEIDQNNYCKKNGYEMRYMFRNSKKFEKYCQNNLLSDKKIMKNIQYDNKNLSLRVKSQIVVGKAENLDDDLDIALKKYNPDFYHKGIYLWGAGKYGKIMLNYMKNYGIKVVAVIDNSDKKIGNMHGNISVISFSEVEKDDKDIFIAVASDEAVRDITEQIKSKHSKLKIHTFNEMYEFIDGRL